MAPETSPSYPRPDFAEIDRTGELTLEHIRYFTETLGAGSLPKMEGGTMKGGGKADNLKTRIQYLKDVLGISPDIIELKERLIADVMTDLITLCQTLTHEIGPEDNPQPLLDNFNALMRFRCTKANLMKQTLASGKTYRQAGLNYSHSPGRSDNPLHYGDYQTILTALESALISKSASTQTSDINS